MSNSEQNDDGCGDGCADDLPKDLSKLTSGYKRALWSVVALNLGYGVVEMVGGFFAESQSLKADALDFLGDGTITLLGLIAIGWRTLWRARSALVQGIFLGAMGVGVLIATLYRTVVLNQPEAGLMTDAKEKAEERLFEQIRVKDEQLKAKDEQIAALNDRLRESNFLMQNLQRQLPEPNKPVGPVDKTAGAKNRGEKKAGRPMRPRSPGWFRRLLKTK